MVGEFNYIDEWGEDGWSLLGISILVQVVSLDRYNRPMSMTMTKLHDTYGMVMVISFDLFGVITDTVR